MTDLQLHHYLCYGLFVLGALTFVSLFFHTAGYGRHRPESARWLISNRASWIGMEIPTVALFVPMIAMGPHADSLATWVITGIWLLHYGYRTLVYPFRLVYAPKRMPVGIVAAGFVFQTLNSYLIASWISRLHRYEIDWLGDWRFVLGTVCFLLALAGNLWSDEILLRLKRQDPSRYQIPRGGLYRWVSSPNYLCEILEWASFALLTWSMSGLAFALYTVANLAPRALAHHRWYLGKFPDYPPERKALVPLVW